MNTETKEIDWAAERDHMQEAHNLMRREYCSIVNGRVHMSPECDDIFNVSCAESATEGASSE